MGTLFTGYIQGVRQIPTNTKYDVNDGPTLYRHWRNVRCWLRNVQYNVPGTDGKHKCKIYSTVCQHHVKNQMSDMCIVCS